MNYSNDYKNLGLEIGASKDDIKKTYRKLAKQFHPDKSNLNDYQDFIKITESYNRLINLEEIDIDNEYKSDEDFKIYLNMYIEIIKNLFKYLCEKKEEYKKYKENQKKQNIEKTKDITINLNINIEQIFNNEVIKVTVKVLKKKNNELYLDKEDVYISLLNYKYEYIFKDLGDEDLEKKRGDIIIKINVIDKNLELDNYDIIYNLNISLYEYLYGIKRIIKYFDDEITLNEKLNINNNKITKIYENKGIKYLDDNEIKYGNLVIKFNINYKFNQNYKSSVILKNLIEKYFN
jgi:DnaJ-class molecular chaperone